MKTLVVLLSLGIPGILLAGGPGSAYIKNTGQDSVQIWVNGSYQGYVRPNETRYSVSDGFITNDSGNGHDGNPVNESHGGWHNNSSDTITVTYQYADGEKKTVQVPANGHGDAALGVTDKDGVKPPPPTDEETEDAAAIIKGNKASLKASESSEEVENAKAVIKGNKPNLRQSDSADENASSELSQSDVLGNWGAGYNPDWSYYPTKIRDLFLITQGPNRYANLNECGSGGSRSWSGTWDIKNGTLVLHWTQFQAPGAMAKDRQQIDETERVQVRDGKLQLHGEVYRHRP